MVKTKSTRYCMIIDCLFVITCGEAVIVDLWTRMQWVILLIPSAIIVLIRHYLTEKS